VEDQRRRKWWKVYLLVALGAVVLGAAGFLLVAVYGSGGPTALPVVAREEPAWRVRANLLVGADVNEADVGGWTALHWAAQRGDLDMMRLLIDGGADVNARSKDIRMIHSAVPTGASQGPLTTPLVAAAAAGHTSAVAMLLDHGAGLADLDHRGRTALHWAAREGEADVLGLLLDRGADPNAADPEGSTPLHSAVRGHGKYHWRVAFMDDPRADTRVDSTGVVGLLLLRGADPNARDRNGWTPLHWAAEEGHHSLAMMLVQKGADTSLTVSSSHRFRHGRSLTVKGAPGQSVLHLAAGSGDLDLARIIVQGGTKADLRDRAEGTPLHEASQAGRAQLAELLLRHGADADAEDTAGWTPMHHAARAGDEETIELLLAHGARVNVATTREQRMPPRADVRYSSWRDEPAGTTPLHLAAVSMRPGAALALLDHKARVNVRDANGSTPLHLAVNRNNPTVAKALLEHGADVNAQDNKGWAPLHDAANQGLAKLPGILLDYGADCTLRDASGRTPLDYARPNSPLRTLLRERESEGRR
jgi:ankyrin repeat protein